MNQNPWIDKFAPPSSHASSPSELRRRTDTRDTDHAGADNAHTGLTSMVEVQALYAQVDAQMTATDQSIKACGAMSAADVATWNGYYASWKAVKDDFLSYQTTAMNLLSLGGSTVALLFKLSFFQSRMQTYQDAIPVWQQKVKLACPTYVPPPLPSSSPPAAPGAPPSPDKPGFFCNTFGWGCPKTSSAPAPTGDWATTILYVAVAAAVIAGFWFFAPALGVVVAGARMRQQRVTPESRQLPA
jgi:hypothetical protein